MTAREEIESIIKTAIEGSQSPVGSVAEQKAVNHHVVKLISWREKWKQLVIPQEYMDAYEDAHAYDHSDDENKDFLEQVLEIWHAHPILRDSICSIFGVQTVSEREERRKIIGLLISAFAAIVGVGYILVAIFKD